MGRAYDRVGINLLVDVQYFKAKNEVAMEKEVRLAKASFNNKVRDNIK